MQGWGEPPEDQALLQRGTIDCKLYLKCSACYPRDAVHATQPYLPSSTMLVKLLVPIRASMALLTPSDILLLPATYT